MTRIFFITSNSYPEPFKCSVTPRSAKVRDLVLTSTSIHDEEGRSGGDCDADATSDADILLGIIAEHSAAKI